MNPNVERRMWEVRIAPSEENEMIVEGYAIRFNEPATHTYRSYSFTEVIKPESLRNADMSDVIMKYNHSDNYLIMARTRNKSLLLTQDEQGLFIRANLIETQSNRDLYTSIQRGLIDKMSFAFTVARDGEVWTYENEGKKATREIKGIERVYDVSAVDSPFYGTTSINVRSEDYLSKVFQNQRDAEIYKLKIKIEGAKQG